MKKIISFVLATIMLLGMFSFGALAQTSLSELDIQAVEGASVRIGEVAGIRFKTMINKAQLDAIVDANGESNVEIGTLITPTKYVKGKRWNQHTLKMTHGTGPVHREPGSMGSISSPSRVFKNKHLAGQYGVENVTIQNLEIVKVDVERNAILIKGAIPGPKGSVVTIANSVKSK